MRTQLESVQRSAPSALEAGANGAKRAAADVEMEEPSGKKAKGGLTSTVTDKLTACSNTLSKGRKKREISSTVATPDDIAGFSLLKSQPLHSSKKGGILAIDVSPAADGVLATAGVDGAVQVFDREGEKVLASLKGHSKKVNSASTSQDIYNVIL